MGMLKVEMSQKPVVTLSTLIAALLFGDILTAETFVVTHTCASVQLIEGSLRQAIVDANANEAFIDEIVFDLTNDICSDTDRDGRHVIEVTFELPEITDSLLIDGFSVYPQDNDGNPQCDSDICPP